MDLDLVTRTLDELGEPDYRAHQIWEWQARGVDGFAAMTNVGKDLRAQLEERVPFSTLALEHEATASDRTQKALFMTHDNRPVEAVLMRYRDGRRSLCLSSQSGCPLTCTFCATGQMAFGRNLTPWEILDQALHFRRIEPVDHCVFMGMGEPMINYDNVIKACDYLRDVGITSRRITISTIGWIPGIEKLTEQPRPIRLALSLHAADPELRTQIMPVNDRYPMPDVLDACRDHFERRNRKVFIEYIMLAGVNDQRKHALQLAGALQPSKAFKVNLIAYNPTDSPYEGSERDAIAQFKDTLDSKGVVATIRLTRGRDINAACGQLAASRA